MRRKIILVDDYPIVRAGIRALVEAKGDGEVVGEANDGIAAVRLAERLQPELLVLDLKLAGLNGLDVLRITKQRSPETKAVVFTGLTDPAMLHAAFQIGITCFVHKTSAPATLLQGMREALAGKRFVTPPFSKWAAEATSPRAKKKAVLDPYETLTPRQRQVLQLAAEGHTSIEIAGRLHISRRTVEMHRGHIMGKLGLRTNIDLIRYAFRRGLISLED